MRNDATRFRCMKCQRVLMNVAKRWRRFLRCDCAVCPTCAKGLPLTKSRIAAGKFAAVALFLITTGCGQAPSAAEMTEALAANSTATATAETPTTVAAEASATPVTVGIPMDYTFHAAKDYPTAVQTCQSESRALCTKVQYDSAYQTGGVAYTQADPGNYWMVKQHLGAGLGYRNMFQATPNGIDYWLLDTEHTRKFYCCK